MQFSTVDSGGEIVNMQDCSLGLSEFELQLCCHIYFQTNNIDIDINLHIFRPKR